ncbi:FAD-binding oxidoreductase [Lutimaribacter sp. EGI FJ00015]|uniref:FAD-binding oxidoreductase n=1 Tax=Lutimaribacter degradans TaxID=2945989 RepID=A0ACC6A018_9RHOB|nr:FAD-dependent oxidoreductase [Lutimaribacter sp. EGI FJ00013]MCM2563686.1 FAD-binding oxidoreductase [Lutimaribacter sp. EGI FJ00013]MCO0614870.1 FAD-binding oxidoreductase [Lutimaribacter sp. EGI FJ00015]MCO0637538.1 FAD-binding oxidoreductase [Lutimaribacter sp. EGI FJ00014]
MVDVTVRGAGIFGLSIAWACARRGARVRVIDPHGPGAGSSGGLVGALAPHVPENWNEKKAFQLDSLLMAEGFWAEVAATGGTDPGYARLGRVQPVMDDRALELAHARAKGADTLWQGRAVWQVKRADDMGDWAPRTPTGWVIHDTLTARMHPRRACAALVAALTAHGVEVMPGGAHEGAVIHATGVAGLEEISQATGAAFGNGVKGQAALVRLDRREAPQLFVDGVHIVPHADGTLAIGSTSERDYDTPSGTDAQLDVVLDKARAAVPALRDAPVIERWAGVRPRSKSRAPVLGAHPLYAGQFIANGGFKIGFGMAPKVAQVMAELVLDGKDSIPEGFRA